MTFRRKIDDGKSSERKSKAAAVIEKSAGVIRPAIF
jgi:hypothetical protein